MRRAGTILVIVTLALVGLGLVMLYSTSSARNLERPAYYLARQLIWLVLGMVAGGCAAAIDYRALRPLAIPIALISLLLLVFVFVPGIGVMTKGSYRWIQLPGGIRFQPSEFAKIAVIVVMAAYMCRIPQHAHEFRRGLLYPLLGLGAFVILLFLEPDYGTTAMVFVVGLVIMFAGGARILYLVSVGAGGGLLFAVALMLNPVRMGRIMAFLWPDRYPDKAYHLRESLNAFYLGGAFGSGLGNSIQKQYYLPEAHTDFIFAILAEELGFVVSMLVLLCFVIYYLCGMTISYAAPDAFGRLLGFGLSMMISIQAAFNIIVVTGLGPTKGLALPFMSYGGSSLVMSLVITGLLISIARSAADEGSHKTAKDRAHEF